MSEPYWVALGASAVDYVGPWAAGTAYAPGAVVTYAGVTYLAVNPSTGQTPPAAGGAAAPIVTTLPGSPADGDEVILVDSLTAPTYSWRLRYVASITDGYRWVFVGGSPAYGFVSAQESTASLSYVALTTPGPVVVLPRAGMYWVGLGAGMSRNTGGNPSYMSYDIGATPAADGDAISEYSQPATSWAVRAYREMPKTFATALTLTAKYKGTIADTHSFVERILRATPMRLA